VFAPELGPLAMQVPALMLVSEQLLQRAADSEDDFVALVLAHEVAHLWFGCLVEGRWWDDLWLAEALATYLSHVAAEEALGLASPWAGFGMREKAAAYRTDSLPGTQPVASPVADAADALSRPAAITYSKGASVIRQLAALIGDDALRAGLRDYLTRYGGGTSTLADLVGCWSAASGRDLAGWAGRWLRAPGVDLLRPELALNPDGTIASFAVLREPPGESTGGERSSAAGAAPAPGDGAPRTHRLAIGVYEREGNRLRRRRVAGAELGGARTALPELTGIPVADAFVLNDGDLTFARTRFDERSFRALSDCAMDVGDPVTEAVCWNSAWDMTTAAELSVAGFTGLAARAIGAGRPAVGLADLLDRAVAAADLYALPAQRPGLRERLAAAALDAAGRATPGSRRQRVLAAGFAASAHSASQVGLLRAWLSGRSLPGGGPADLDLRRQILATLSARGLAADEDLDALVADDPVLGLTHAATCRALRPDPAAKDAAWTAALAADQGAQLALAHARGIWAPGQEAILAAYRERYFAEALGAVAPLEPTLTLRLTRLLYPLTLADPATVAATDAALRRPGIGEPVRLVLREQRAITQQIRAARTAATTG
jgi:aminopeptidase N